MKAIMCLICNKREKRYFLLEKILMRSVSFGKAQMAPEWTLLTQQAHDTMFRDWYALSHSNLRYFLKLLYRTNSSKTYNPIALNSACLSYTILWLHFGSNLEQAIRNHCPIKLQLLTAQPFPSIDEVNCTLKCTTNPLFFACILWRAMFHNLVWTNLHARSHLCNLVPKWSALKKDADVRTEPMQTALCPYTWKNKR